MFWGLIMEPNRRYTQTVERSFHVSMASLDSSTADDKIVQVMLYYDELNYLLCSLQKGQTWQVPLDLNFEEGTKIAFTSNGCGHVHLTGYLIPEENLDMDDMEEGSEEEEEDEEEIPQLVVGQPKRKAQESPKDSKSAKRTKAVAAKRDESSDEDDDGESEDDEEESPKINGAANEDDDSDDLEEEDEDDEEEEDDDSSEEEEEIEVKPQQKKQKIQKEQQQPLSKKEKQKVANGKDAKQEQKKVKAETTPPQQQKKNKAEQQQQQQAAKKRVVEGGVQVEDVKVGGGAPAKSGKFVSVYYVGRLTNGKKFDSTTTGEGFKFRLGKGEVIKGWDIGIAGMKIGGKRRITIPPGMAYGAKGSPPVIPGNSTLVFEVELKNVH